MRRPDIVRWKCSPTCRCSCVPAGDGDRLKSGPLPVRKATETGTLIARGLAAAHESGLVHRDLKPDNVFLTNDGWRADGRELYYISATNQMMAVPVRSSAATFDVDTPTVLFQTSALRVAGYHYVTTADGERFLVNESLPVEGTPSINLVINWPTLLKGTR